MLEQPSPDLHHASVVARVCVARDSSQVCNTTTTATKIHCSVTPS
jgi:hypothetical protein